MVLSPDPPSLDGRKGYFSFFTLKQSRSRHLIGDSCAQISCGKMLRCRITCVGIIHSKGGWRWGVLELQTSRLGALWRQEQSFIYEWGLHRGQMISAQIFTQCLGLFVHQAFLKLHLCARGRVGPGSGRIPEWGAWASRSRKMIPWERRLHECGFLGLSLRIIFSICLSVLGLP